MTGKPVIATPASEKIDPKVWCVSAVVFVGPLMAQLDSTVVNFSLSQIRTDLNATLAAAQWIVSGYLLALALMLPLNGYLVERLGSKRLYLLCFLMFTVTSFLCGMAPNMEVLIGARVLQGMAGGLLAPLTQMMMARVAGKHFSRVVGYSAVPVLLAPLIGPTLAGAILKYAAWPWLFFINVPIGIIATGLAAWLLPADEGAVQKRSFDFLGFLLISPGMVSLIYGFEHISTDAGPIFAIAGVALMAGFVFHAVSKKAAALVDLRLFGNPVFRTAAGVQFLSNGVLFSGQMLIPLYLIVGCGFDVTKSGLLLAPMGIGMMVIAPMMGFLTDRFGCRRISAGGVAVNILGTIPFLWMIHSQFSSPLMVLCMLARGAGQGATGIPSLSAAYASVRKDQLGLAATASNMVQRLGGPIGTATLAFIIIWTARDSATPNAHEFTIPFLALIILQAALFAVALRLPVWVPQRNDQREERKAEDALA